MIVGNGDIAKVLNDREGFLFFASGVSNSNCVNEAEYIREIKLLESQDRSLCCVYFSTISIYDKKSMYTDHKRWVEFAIKSWFKNYCIIRIGNIDFGTNPNTFLNYIRNQIRNNKPYNIRDEYKYMISRDQLLFVTNNIPSVGHNEICVFGYKSKVINLL